MIMKSRQAGKTIATKSYVLDFGKHKGKTVNWVLQNDPGYIMWLDSQNIIQFSQEIIDNAEDNDERDWDGGSDFPSWMEEPF